jgi:HEAT repeat protein
MTQPEGKDVKPQPLSDAAFAEAWDAISGERAPRALVAVQRLAAGGDDAVKRMRERLLAPVGDGKPTVEELIAMLDHEDFAKREKATRTLLERGAVIVPKLRAALKEPPSLEARKRLESLLGRLSDPTPTPDEMRAVRAVTALVRIGSPASRALLKELAEGPETAPRTIAAKGAFAHAAPEK